MPKLAWFERNVGVVKIFARASRVSVYSGPPNLQHLPTPMVLNICISLNSFTRGCTPIKIRDRSFHLQNSDRMAVLMATLVHEDDTQHSLRIGDTVLLYAEERKGFVFSELTR